MTEEVSHQHAGGQPPARTRTRLLPPRGPNGRFLPRPPTTPPPAARPRRTPALAAFFLGWLTALAVGTWVWRLLPPRAAAPQAMAPTAAPQPERSILADLPITRALHEGLCAAVERLKNEKAAHEADLAALATRHEELQRLIAAATTQVPALTAQVATLTAEVAKAQRQLAALADERQQEEIRLADARKIREGAEAEAARAGVQATETARATAAQIAALAEQRAAAERQTRERQQQLKSLEQRLAAVEQRVAAAEQRQRQAEAQAQQLLAQARREAEAIRAEAQRTAVSVTEDAHQRAKATMANALQNARRWTREGIEVVPQRDSSTWPPAFNRQRSAAPNGSATIDGYRVAYTWTDSSGQVYATLEGAVGGPGTWRSVPVDGPINGVPHQGLTRSGFVTP